MGENLFDALKKQLYEVVPDERVRAQILQSIERISTEKLNILLVGATGVGKSSTINALFNSEIAKVGYSADPETKNIQKYDFNNLVLWDSPGIGDSPEKDRNYAKQIANKLLEKDSNGNYLIDEVLVIVDGSSRDLGTTYELIDQVIKPYIHDTERFVIAINQCDAAMKGRDWSEVSGPGPQLTELLNQKVESVKRRIAASTGIQVQPIYYSALYHYNISSLLALLLQKMPETKRFLVADALNKSPDIWKKNDNLSDYNREIQEEIQGSLSKAITGAKDGALAGAAIGNIIPVIGPVIGAAVGGILGFLGGLFGL